MSEVFRNKRPLAAVERYGPWPPPPFRADRVKLTSPEELRSWIVHEDENLLVVNKSGEVVCHPSKFGPTSSLVGAARRSCPWDSAAVALCRPGISVGSIGIVATPRCFISAAGDDIDGGAICADGAGLQT